MDIKISQSANLPSRFGQFSLQVFKEGEKEHLCITKGEIKDILNVRIHSECLTGDALGSMKCDCGEQLEFALRYIQANGGMVIYLRQEGRGIGLLNKINAYALQDTGLDTVEANLKLGFKDDERDYRVVEFIFKHYGISKINLLTNNPSKLNSVEGVQIVKRIPIIIEANSFNKEYLQIKHDKMGHLF
mgnify:FL=1